MRILFRCLLPAGAAAAAMVALAVPAAAQVRTIDPNQAIDADLAPGQRPPARTAEPEPVPIEDAPPANAPATTQAAPASTLPPANPGLREAADADAARGHTFTEPELLNAAEGVFGKGAAGLAGILEKTLKEQGRPNAYISGKEASGALVVGLRYGQGTMFHKIEGQQPVYWTGPSVGFDLGGDANKVFVLVYNLYDSEDLYTRFPAAEGRLYLVGGFAATYLRRGNVVLIPIRLGVGWRQGVNVGYMKFSHKNKWLPF